MGLDIMYGERERNYLSLFGGRYGMGYHATGWQLVEWTGMETASAHNLTFSEIVSHINWTCCVD